MIEKEAHYLAYLLRLWRDTDSENVWRVSIESPHTGECRGFAGLEELLAFLCERTSMPRGEVETGLNGGERGDELMAGELE
jgi:hypothetical protein